jgi:nucleotide-binding universal stress UspA family protein
MKALWSYEPFHQDKKRITIMAKLLGQLIDDPDGIRVGFVASHSNTNLSLAFDVPKSKRFNEYPKAQIIKELKAAKVKIGDGKVNVIEFHTYSMTRMVDQLIKLASDQGSDLIGLFTHARKGYRRLLMGSFAETIMHRSQADLLLLNPKVESKKQTRHILFASDFGSSASAEFSKIFNYARNLNAHLTVFHHADVTYKTSFDEGSQKIKNYREKIDKMKAWIERQAEGCGVKVNVLIFADFSSTVGRILKLVKKNKIDMIAISAKTGALAALMGGSMTRQISRESSVPILVLKIPRQS